MRRSHTTRHQTRASGLNNINDLGLLKESEENVEVSLRKQLLDKDRENDRLQAQIESLQAQLADRPPIETIQAVQRERQNLELLLQGTQRENEKSMEALERSKTREKLLERKLTELLGENWQSALEIAPPPARGFHGHGHSRSMSSPMSPSPRSGTPLSLNHPSIDTQQKPAAAAAPATLDHIEQVRMLVLGMEQRLQVREQKLSKVVEQAENEAKRFEDGRKAVLGTKS